VVDGRAALQAWRNAGASEDPSSPFSAESEKIQVPQVGELNVNQAAREPSGARLPLVQVVDQDKTPVSGRLPVPPQRRTLSAPAGRCPGQGRVSGCWPRRRGAGGRRRRDHRLLATPPRHRRREGLRAKMAAAISAGTCAACRRRATGQADPRHAPGDGDALAGLAFVEALLLRDYGLGQRRDAEAAWPGPRR
jgi:hypothetical protein